MDDDMIDIEEHDLMENPVIKQIFPDLSALKKEIVDYDVETQEGFINRNSHVINGVNKNLERATLHKPLNVKTNLIPVVKIYLKNIKHELKRSQKFCQICSILFSEKEGLKNHQIFHHNDKNCRRIQHAFVNSRLSKTHSDEINLKFSKNYPVISKDTASRSQNEINEIDVMVKINNSYIKTTDNSLMKPCFHCDDVFSSPQSLIDHLYEILYNKTSIPKSVDNRINNNDGGLQNVINNLQKNKLCQAKSKILYYSCPVCSYYFAVENMYKCHLEKKHNIKKIKMELVKFYSKCKFCYKNCNDVFSYNKHLRTKHSSLLISKKIDNIFPVLVNKMLNAKEKKIIYHQNRTFKINSKLYPQTSHHHEAEILKRRMNGVCIMASKAILFKCIKCNIHFLTEEAAKNHVEHIELLKHWKCTNCQNLFKQEQQNIHEKQHKYSNCFTVVEVKSDNRKKGTKVSFNSGQKKRSSDCIFMNPEISDTKTNGNQSKQNFKSETSMEIYKHLYFCNTCKCNISENDNASFIDDHLQSNCTWLMKHVCEYCGLVFCNRTINSHKSLHQQYNNLNLHDFTFYDINTKSRINPIFDFPKCEVCEKHFIHNHEIAQHLCKENSKTCPVCKIKLTDSALKLHEPFHSYEQKLNNLVSSHFSSSVTEIKKVDNNLSFSNAYSRGDDEVLYLYTCKNCDMSINNYDEVIEHCQSHTHLNKIETDTLKCKLCSVKLNKSSYHQHQMLHDTYTKEKFKYIYFDVVHFNTHNKKWLDHLFGVLPRDTINKIIEKSIYRYENRIRMNITQNGPYTLTIYKCEKCQCIIDGKCINEHIVNCSDKLIKFYCEICKIPFVNSISKMDHEKTHLDFNTTLESYRIVAFNRKQDEVTNRNVSKTKYYVIFECRHCHVAIEKNVYKNHKCNYFKLKNCNICGLLLKDNEYDMHLLKHKLIDSFNKHVMKVVLIGNETIKKEEIKTSSLISTFNGMLCDYTFYKCVKCDVCIKDFRNTTQHYCLIDAAKSKCPQCDLIFDEGKLKGHLKLHDTDPDFTKETISVKTFGCNLDIKKKSNY